MTHRCLTLIAVATLCGCSAGDPSARIERPAEGVRVLAGDILVVGGQTIRLANAQAPALPPDARCWGEAALAVQAAAKAQALVEQARGVTLTPAAPDLHGAAQARVALDGRRDLGEALIFAGLAARRSKVEWDWCGPADFHRTGGPGFDSGPQANAAFVAWAAAEQHQQMDESLARMLIEAGPAFDAAEAY